jgi:hypothetical protein
MKKIWLIISVIVFVIVIAIMFYFFQSQTGEFQLNPVQKTSNASTDVAGTEVGTGWSNNEDPVKATREAVAMALKGKKHQNPDFAIFFATSGSDIKAIHPQIQKLLGDKTKIFGGTSDTRCIMTDKGFERITSRRYEYAINEKKRGLSLMTITSTDISFGVSVTDFSGFPTIQAAAKAALSSAIQNSGRLVSAKPQAILMASTNQVEEEVIEGIQSLIGKTVPLIGGTVGGWKFGVVDSNHVYEKGVALAVIYTKFPVGWTFEGGFDVKDPHSAVVTKLDNDYTIAEIDHKPALDVYNEWRNNEVYDLFKKNGKADEISDLVTLNPLYRKYTAPDGQDYYLFQYLWLNDDTLKKKSILTSTKIKLGDRLYLSHGSWETLLNRIGNLPKNAKSRGNISINQKPLLGIGIICAGILGTIPENDREKIALLINYGNNEGVPFIFNFTWGEQGLFPGIGYKHGNLLTSYLVIGYPK